MDKKIDLDELSIHRKLQSRNKFLRHKKQLKYKYFINNDNDHQYFLILVVFFITLTLSHLVKFVKLIVEIE